MRSSGATNGPWDPLQRDIKRFAALQHLQSLFRFWRVLRCREVQPQYVPQSKHFLCVCVCVWLWIFIYSVLSFLIFPNYYFFFPFKNSLSKLTWLIIVSNTVRVALLEHNMFLLWSSAYLDLHLSGYWFLLRNQSFSLSLSAEKCPGILFIWMLQCINPSISRARLGSWCEDVPGFWFFSLCGLVRQSLPAWVRSEQQDINQTQGVRSLAG